MQTCPTKRAEGHRLGPLLAVLLVLACVAVACSSSSPGDIAQATPTSDERPATVLPTPLPLPTSTPVPSATPFPEPTPSATTAPTSTPEPVPTATTVPPTATSIPAPTATQIPAPPTATPAPAIWVGCDITPQRAVNVGEILTYTALQNPVTAAVTFTFDHGDGTLDPGAISEAFYRMAGVYNVRLHWSYAGTVGTIECGQVVVVSSWPTPTPTPTPPVAISCTIDPARTVTVGEILTYTASQVPATTPIQYVFDHGDGTLDPGPISKAFYAAPGLYQVSLNWDYNGRTGTVSCGSVSVVAAPGTPTATPTPTVVIGCDISPRQHIAVNEIVTYTAFQSPANVPVQYVFDHGDGTLDPGPISMAYYPAPGTYGVRLNWAHSGQTGQILCGVVTVTS